jgi:predicted nucleic acid-binding protein
MSYLLDANVLSEIRKQSRLRPCTPGIKGNVKDWLRSVSASELYLSVITVLELDRRFVVLEHRDRGQDSILPSRARNKVLTSFNGRILSIDLAVAEPCAMLDVPDPIKDRDALIAATAFVNCIALVTRNVSHLQRSGLTIFNPSDCQPVC